MKITDVRSVCISVPFAVFGRFQPMTMWYGKRSATNHAIIFIDTDEGITGIGETWARNEYEVLNTVKPRILGLDPLDIENITAISIDRSRGILRGVNPSTISAIDCALWDIMGKACNKPLYKLLGGKVNDRVRCRYWMCEKAPNEQAAEAIKAVERGWKAFKIKIGVDPARDIECVKAVREAVGDDIELGFDLNGSYSLHTAIRTLKRMERYGPHHIEEPIPALDFDGHVELKKHTNIPIEFHWNGHLRLAEVMRLVRIRALDLLHLNPMQNGGLLYCNKLCAIAEAAGIPVTGQSSAAELGPANAELLHWITSNPAFTCTNDSSTHLLEPPSGDIIKKEFRTKEGCLTAPEGSGLGIEVDQDKLKKYHNLWLTGKYKPEPGPPRTDTHYW
ncbi:MAG: mandelate racemase/muconate lactonizing enzyme family protein [Candidatus Bathyarchaeia archaeon]